jgi:hypothetical protein
MNWKRVAITLSVVAVVAFAMALAPSEAQARGHHGGGRVFVGGFGFDPYFASGWGYGPYYPYWGFGPGPYYGGYGYAARADTNAAMIAGVGGLDMKVKPGAAEVWVDGKYVTEAKNLDGSPSYLWMKEGTHQLQIRKGGFATFETQVDVQRGILKEFKLHLKPGESGAAPAPAGTL